MIDKLAIYISILALIYTAYVDNKSHKFSKKTTKESVMAVFFVELYFKIITIEIPTKMKSFNNENCNKITLEEIEKLLIDILDKSLFYKYYDKPFYERIKKNIVKSQDLFFQIYNALDTGIYRNDTYGLELESSISTLYTTMINYYSSI